VRGYLGDIIDKNRKMGNLLRSIANTANDPQNEYLSISLSLSFGQFFSMIFRYIYTGCGEDLILTKQR
jgi:hypothetical protein